MNNIKKAINLLLGFTLTITHADNLFKDYEGNEVIYLQNHWPSGHSNFATPGLISGIGGQGMENLEKWNAAKLTSRVDWTNRCTNTYPWSCNRLMNRQILYAVTKDDGTPIINHGVYLRGNEEEITGSTQQRINYQTAQAELQMIDILLTSNNITPAQRTFLENKKTERQQIITNVESSPNIQYQNVIIHGIAKGRKDSDAVNMSQLRSLTGNVTTVNNQITQLQNGVNNQMINIQNNVSNQMTQLQNDVNGISSNVIAVNHQVMQLQNEVKEINGNVTAVKQDMINLRDDVKDTNDDLKAGIAGAAALSLLQTARPGGNALSVGVGTYKGENALAIGLSAASEDGKWVIKAGASINSRSEAVGGGSLGYHW